MKILFLCWLQIKYSQKEVYFLTVAYRCNMKKIRTLFALELYVCQFLYFTPHKLKKGHVFNILYHVIRNKTN